MMELAVPLDSITSVEFQKLQLLQDIAFKFWLHGKDCQGGSRLIFMVSILLVSVLQHLAKRPKCVCPSIQPAVRKSERLFPLYSAAPGQAHGGCIQAKAHLMLWPFRPRRSFVVIGLNPSQVWLHTAHQSTMFPTFHEFITDHQVLSFTPPP